MKRLIVLAFGFWVFNSLAQPTSLAGINPGRTTLEELKNLVQPDGRLTKNIGEGNNYVKITALDGRSATVEVLNGVVYRVRTYIIFDNTLLDALIAKYGKPTEIIGSIDKVVCENKLGGKFDRVQGVRRELWPQKDGVQAEVELYAGECSQSATSSYIINHLQTIEEIKRKVREEEDKIKSDKINKVKDLL